MTILANIALFVVCIAFAGAIYLVERLKAVNVPGGIIRKGLILRGVKSLPHAFRATRFRPIYRPKSDLIESLKTPAKREGVPA